MIRNLYKRITLILTAALFLMASASAPAAAQPEDSAAPTAEALKEEVVYANLQASGQVNEIYVVNILNVKKAGTIADYGRYLTIKNLTSTLSLSQGNGQISADLPAGNFYYQGTLDGTDLPWTIAISYYLDGAKLSPDALAGKSGRLQIAVSTAANSKVDASFFDNYILQISIYLDADKCGAISADGATIANAGKNKLINYTIMPGETANINVSADVTDFEMPGIEMSAVPFSMQINTPDTSELSDDMTLLSDAVNDLYEGIGELKYGAWKLKDGAADLKTGSAGFKKGLNDLSAGSASLISGSSQVKSGLDAILSSLSGSSGSFSLGSLTALPGQLAGLASGLNDISAALTGVKTNFASAFAALDAAMAAIPDDTITSAEIEAIKADSPANSALMDQLYGAYTAATAAKAAYNSTAKPMFTSVGPTLDTLIGNIDTISSSLSTMSSGIQSGLDAGGVDTAVASLAAGLTALSTNYSTFHQGLVTFTGGVSELAANYGSLNTGVAGLSDGASGMYSGIRELYNGTEELNTAVADMPEQIELKIDAWMDAYDRSDFEPVSFTSPRNNTESVQFIIKTEKIEKPQAPQAPAPEEKENFWTRFLDLFR